MTLPDQGSGCPCWAEGQPASLSLHLGPMELQPGGRGERVLGRGVQAQPGLFGGQPGLSRGVLESWPGVSRTRPGIQTNKGWCINQDEVICQPKSDRGPVSIVGFVLRLGYSFLLNYCDLCPGLSVSRYQIFISHPQLNISLCTTINFYLLSISRLSKFHFYLTSPGNYIWIVQIRFHLSWPVKYIWIVQVPFFFSYCQSNTSGLSRYQVLSPITNKIYHCEWAFIFRYFVLLKF